MAINHSFDKETKVLYISFAEEAVQKTLSFPNLNVDISSEGKIVGIEIVDGSRVLPESFLEELIRIENLRQQPRDFLSPGC